MSLLQRIERAHNGAAIPSDSAIVPHEPPPPPDPARALAREEYLADMKARVQQAVIGAHDALRDVSDAAEARSMVEAIVNRIIETHRFSVSRDERLRVVEEVVNDFTGLGPIEPFLDDETVTEVMVNGPAPYLHRARREDRARRHRLPE